MLSPVKAITAAVLALALSAAALGATTAADPATPVEVTGKLIDINCGVDSVGPGASVVEERVWTCEVDMEWSDPRLQGTDIAVENSIEYTDGSGLSIGHYTHDIVTDDGAWRMRPQFTFNSADGPGNFSGTWVLDGEGAYEGFSVVLAKDELNSVPLVGYIISTDVVPPAPEGASTQ